MPRSDDSQFGKRMRPWDGTRTRRKQHARNVRDCMGVSREQPPGVLDAIDAAQELDHIMRDAAAGELRVAIMHVDEAGRQSYVVSPELARVVSYKRARDLAREEA